MKIILLNNINNLGHFGDIVNVKSGYARNYLIPKKKAISATEENIKYYTISKNKILEEEKIKNQTIEDKIFQLQKLNLILKSKASIEGKLYGSIKITHIIKELENLSINIQQKNLKLKTNIKQLGKQKIKLLLYNTKEIEIEIEIIKG